MPLLLHLLFLSVSQHSRYRPEIASLSAVHQPLGHHVHNPAPQHRVQLGFPTSCLRRHVGGTHGVIPKCHIVVRHLLDFIGAK